MRRATTRALGVSFPRSGLVGVAPGSPPSPPSRPRGMWGALCPPLLGRQVWTQGRAFCAAGAPCNLLGPALSGPANPTAGPSCRAQAPSTSRPPARKGTSDALSSGLAALPLVGGRMKLVPATTPGVHGKSVHLQSRAHMLPMRRTKDGLRTLSGSCFFLVRRACSYKSACRHVEASMLEHASIASHLCHHAGSECRAVCVI